MTPMVGPVINFAFGPCGAEAPTPLAVDAMAVRTVKGVARAHPAAPFLAGIGRWWTVTCHASIQYVIYFQIY